MAQRQVLVCDDDQRSWRLAPTGKDVENDIVAGDTRQQCFTDGRLDEIEPVVEHRGKHAHEPPVCIIASAELTPQP